MEIISLVPHLSTNLNRLILAYLGPEEYYNAVQYLNRSMYHVKDSSETMSELFVMYQPLLYDYDQASESLRCFVPSECQWNCLEISLPIKNEVSFLHTPENMLFCFSLRPVNSILVFNPVKKIFQKVAQLPVLKKDFGIIRVGKRIFTVGGVNSLDCERFEYVQRKVYSVSPAKIKAVSFSLCAIDEAFIYRFAFSQDGYQSGTHQNNSLIERYSISENVWTVIVVGQVGTYKPLLGLGCISVSSDQILVLGRAINKTAVYSYKIDANGGQFQSVAVPQQHLIYPDTFYPWRQVICEKTTDCFLVEGGTRVWKINPSTNQIFQYGL